MTDKKPPADDGVETEADDAQIDESLAADDSPEVSPETGETADEPTTEAEPTPEQPQAEPEPPIAATADPADDAAEDGEVEPEAPAVDKARRKRPVSGAALAAQKKKAEKIRREEAIEAGKANAGEPDEALIAEDERKQALMDEMEELDAEAQEADAVAAEARRKIALLLTSLYPQQGPNDPHHKAVRGYLTAASAERKNRALAPARLKEMLIAAGRAPIDNAFSRKAARGFNRPKRKLATQGKEAAQDQAPGGTPDKAAAAAAE